MKTAFLLIPVVILSACASLSNTQFTGESASYNNDNILRNDVFAAIKRNENLAFQCRKINSVNAVINGASRPNGLLYVTETWTVQACGKIHAYDVTLRQDAKNETDFGVSFKP
ncbi:MAG: hypothetical protein Q4A84_03575 [Neisseria sp.]|uniref:hypothetical protein n=1 Tax=Neisseria sp. TaxID=192066 RepID=UPI0026DAF124|nr:hypothetical protein [Neisseria sp.]MDO4640769.1 hypothetical protein [Neisseria sp.]